MEQFAISLNQLFGWSIGTSVIVACLISALWSIYFNRIKEGQKAEFQKQIENQKKAAQKRQQERQQNINNIKNNANSLKNSFKLK